MIPYSYLVAFVLVLGFNQSMAVNFDSLRIETRNGVTTVLHQVESKETLYSLARRYGTEVAKIQKANPELDNGLRVGQTIRIPYQLQSVPESSGNPNATYHTVTAQQTLYSLAATYGVTVDQLREWNNLSGNDLDVGQRLIVGQTKGVVPIKETNTSTEPEEYTQVIKVPEREIPATIIVKPGEVGNDRIVKEESGFTEILENGLAEVIEDSNDTRKYLALHKTAPVGTILQIKNEMNNLRVFVRVIGKLPDTGNNQKILLKISKAAYDRLGAIDPRFPVVVSYFL